MFFFNEIFLVFAEKLFIKISDLYKLYIYRILFSVI